tara:strand:+ start:151 stop:321 length:171 start_codon:yes stop_codon:yes gene_type:complete
VKNITREYCIGNFPKKKDKETDSERKIKFIKNRFLEAVNNLLAKTKKDIEKNTMIR